MIEDSHEHALDDSVASESPKRFASFSALLDQMRRVASNIVEISTLIGKNRHREAIVGAKHNAVGECENACKAH